MSEWIWPAACQAVSPLRRCHDCAGFASPAVKKAIRSSSENAPRTTRCSPLSAIPSSSRITAASSSSSSRQLRLDARGDGDRAARRAPPRARPPQPAPRRRPRRRWRRTAPAWPSAARGRAARWARRPAAAPCAPGGPACSAAISSLQPRLLGDRGLVAAARAPSSTRSRRRSACSRSAYVSSVSIVSMSARGSTRPSGWTTFSSPCARTTCTIASVSRMFARNLLPSPSPSDAPLTSPAMSWKAIVSWTTSRRPQRRRDPLQPLVGDRHDRDVRLDRRERVVGGLGAGARQRVEERGLARVRHADDADLHRARPPIRPIVAPSSTPATISDG